MNNSLATRKNLYKFGVTSSSECSFCLLPETLVHVVAGCSSYLNRFNWRHDSILNFIAKNIPSDKIKKIFADLPSFSNRSMITGELFRPDLIILTKDNTLFILELTVWKEINRKNNINRKHTKYKELIDKQKKKFPSVIFVNLSISAGLVFLAKNQLLI